MLAWYVNIRESGGLRLTEQGYQTLSQGGITSYRFAVTEKRWLSKRMLLYLDRRMRYPYYIEKSGLVMFSSRDAVMLNLYGDIKQWLATLG
jgi:hypothetical protein